MLMTAGLRAVDVDQQVGTVPADCRLPALSPHPRRQVLPARGRISARPPNLLRPIEERAGSCQSAYLPREAPGSTIGRKPLPLAWEIVITIQSVAPLSGFAAVA